MDDAHKIAAACLAIMLGILFIIKGIIPENRNDK